MKVRSALVTSFLVVFALSVINAQAPTTDTAKPPESTPPKPASPAPAKPPRPKPPEPVQPKPHPVPPTPKPKPIQPLAPKPNNSAARQSQASACPTTRSRIWKTPEIAWYPAPRMQFGQALSLDQLNATADVPGTYSYNPGFGYVPPRGTLVVTLTFLPNDTCDYNMLSTNRSIDVQ